MTFRIVRSSTGDSFTAPSLRAAYSIANDIARAEGYDSVAPIAGTYVVAYHSTRRCGGHEIARLHETQVSR